LGLGERRLPLSCARAAALRDPCPAHTAPPPRNLRGGARLTSRAPVGGSVRIPLTEGADRRPAARAGAPGAVVDALRQLSAGVDGGAHERRGGFERVSTVGLDRLSQPQPRRQARLPERLRHPHVAYSGYDALVLQDLSEPPLRIDRA